MAAFEEAPMDVGDNNQLVQQQAEKYLRLQQLISTGDVAAIRVVLQEGPKLEQDDLYNLWFDLFRQHHTPDNVLLLLLQCFLEHGVNPEEVDEDSMSALHLACSHCLRDCVALLLQELSPDALNEADVFGMLPLHHAISMCKTTHALLEGDELRNSSDSVGLRSSSDFTITPNDLPTAESIVAMLLDHGAHVNLTDSSCPGGNGGGGGGCSNSGKPPSYTTPLCFAVDIGNVRVVEMLLKAGAVVNPSLGRVGGGGGGEVGGCPRKCPPLQCALDNSDIPLAELLVQHGARCDVKLADNSFLLHHYCNQGNLPAVQFLLNNDVPMNNPAGSRKETPLQVAAAHGYADIMQELLSRGATIPTETSSPLLTSTAFSGNANAVKLLLDHGVPLNTQGTFGITAIYVACSKSTDMVELLLRAGADPNLGGLHHKPVFNILPLHRRSQNHEAPGIVRALLKHNADMDVRNKDHFYKRGSVQISLFHRALLCGEVEVVEMLLKAGASVNGTTKEMTQSFVRTCSAKNRPIIELLQYQLRNPYTLAQMCRTAIRKCFHACKINDVQSLPLPSLVKDYLCYCDL